MHNVMRPLLLSFMLAAAALVTAMPAKSTEILWMKDNDPPYYIPSGALSGHGALDEILQNIIQISPEYSHKTKTADNPRIFYELEHNDAVCYLGSIQNKTRENFIAFSKREIKLPGVVLIFDKNKYSNIVDKLDQNGEIILSAFHDDSLTGGYLSGYGYSDKIADFIGKKDRSIRLIPIPSFERLTLMLLAGRIDFFIGEYEAARYFADLSGVQDRIGAVRISGSPAFVSVHIGCSNRAIGHAVIEKLDRELADEATWSKLLAPLQRWMVQTDVPATQEIRH